MVRHPDRPIVDVCVGILQLEVLSVSIHTSHENDEAQIILDALREIQENPEMQAQIEQNPDSILNRLGLFPLS